MDKVETAIKIIADAMEMEYKETEAYQAVLNTLYIVLNMEDHHD